MENKVWIFHLAIISGNQSSKIEFLELGSFFHYKLLLLIFQLKTISIQSKKKKYMGVAHLEYADTYANEIFAIWEIVGCKTKVVFWKSIDLVIVIK